MEHTRFTAFFATAMIGLAATQVSAQQTYFGDESEIEVQSWDTEGLYVSISGLLVLPDDSDLGGPSEATIGFDPGAGLSAAIGYEFGGHWRGEVQYSYMELELNSTQRSSGSFDVAGNASVQSLMLNAYYDFPFTVQIEPYAGFGAGVAYHVANFSGEDRENDTTFALQLMAGVGYKLDARTTLSVGVRSFATDEVGLGAAYDEFLTVVFEFGIRFGF